MESQNSLEIEWSNHEIMPKEDEVFSFQHQLPPLDLRYPEPGCSNYNIDSTYFMDIISNNPICSSMDTLPDPTLNEYANFLVGRDGELGFLDQEILTTNSISFPNQAMFTMNSSIFPNQDMSLMNSIGFPNQEMYMMNNISEFSYQTQQAIMDTKEQKKLDRKGNDGGNGDCGVDFNSPSRMTALSREMISQYFYKPIDQAAKELNIGKTLLKKRCRDLGIRRWPYRKLMSLQTLITNIQQKSAMKSGTEVDEKLQEAIVRLENEKKKMEELPDLQLEDNTKRLRQACFKANYKKKKTIGKNSSTLSTYRLSPSSCSSTCVDYGGYEAFEDEYGGDDAELEMKSVLFTGGYPSLSDGYL
ncbi:hypothetical protein LXL04_030636 [Taraxacum kok-saghyz]